MENTHGGLPVGKPEAHFLGIEKEEKMANNYTITFMPLRATAGAAPYVLIIGGGTGTAIPLQPGEQPFTTQESDDEDMFCPIRTQTGYFRIVDDGKDINGNAFDWKDLIPATDTSRPVTLTRGGTIVWRGFMQAQDFGSVLYGNPQEREFPVQCVLSVLGGTDINYQQTAIQNFAYLLQQIVEAIPQAQRPMYFYIQGGANAQGWLLKRIDWQNFVSEDADGLTARYTMYQCLEDMCRFWGWTARTKGRELYLTCADDSAQTSWLGLTTYQLSQLAAYTSGTIPGDVSYTFQSANLSGDIFASTDNNEYVQRGVDKATVDADINAADEKIIETYPSSVENIMANRGYYYENYDGITIYYSTNLLSFNSAYLTGNCRENYGSFNIMRIVENMNNPTIVNAIRILKSFTTADATNYASMATVYEHAFPGDAVFFGYRPKGIELNGTAYFKGKKYEDYDGVSGVGNKSMYMRLAIGSDRNHAAWFNGSGWQGTPTAFKVQLGNRDNSIWYHNGSGYRTTIALPSGNTYAGLVFVDFIGSDDMPEISGERKFDLVNFDLTYIYSNADENIMGEKSKDTGRTYKSMNNSHTSQDWSTDCIYASVDNGLARGYGIVMNADYSFMEEASYGNNVTAHPEQHLADRVTTYWATSKRRLAIEPRSDAAISQTMKVRDITPRHKVTIDGMTGYPIAISHEWRDDVTQLTILQL